MKPERTFDGIRGIVALAWILPLCACALARGQEAALFRSNEVHPDGTITFRYKDPAAGKVLLELSGVANPLPMQKDLDGLWTVVTPPLPPELYEYTFQVDGRAQIDPKNSNVVPNLLYPSSMVAVGGSTPQPWDVRNVPHGIVHHHFYTSAIVVGLQDGQSDFYVYTPPGYDPKRPKPYPVLYLLHGWSDLANAWTEVGKANFIFDNLIAEGKVQPMLVVMPLGYGEMNFVRNGDGVWEDHAAVNRNVSLFSQALRSEVLPRVEASYHVSKKRDDRAIAGLSMGGLESLTIGLTHSDQFAWVGGFSSAATVLEKDPQPATLSGKTVDLHLLWIACGTEDELLSSNRKFIEWLHSRGVALTAIETPGMHTWAVWRDNLVHFAHLLFKSN
jgi:enterochelin esterase family protein